MERYKDFDAAKGIASYLVVLGHLLTQIGNSKAIIIIFCHMPLFFFISGYLMYFSLHKYGSMSFLRKKFKSLFMPYIIWSFVSYLANVLMGIRDKQMAWEEFIDIFFRARSVWFLIELFISLTVLALSIHIAKVIKINQYMCYIIIWLLMALSIPNDIFSFVKFKWLFPFMVIGYVLAERRKSIQFSIADISIFLKGLVTLFPVIALGAYLEPYFTNYISFHYTSGIDVLVGIGYYLISVWGICFIILAAHYIPGVLSEIGKYSIHIYVIHMFMIKFIFYAPAVIRKHSWIYLWIYMPIYAAAVIMLIVVLSKRILDKSRLFRIMVGK